MKKESGYINGYEREQPSLGTMYERNSIVNALPCIGSSVIVEVYKIKSKNTILPLRDEEGYMLHEGYLDILGRPRVYVVESYTQGMDNPFDEHNSVVLKTTLGDARTITQTIKTRRIVSGYIRLTNAPKEEEVVCDE